MSNTMTERYTRSATPWTLQVLETGKSGYKDWTTYAIRDAHNHCIAVVGDVDRATEFANEKNALVMLAAPELLSACKSALAFLRHQNDDVVFEIETHLQAVIERATGVH